MNEQDTYKLIQDLSEATSNTGGTSLPTLLVPGGTQMSIIMTQLNSELATSHNIKDKNVRGNIQSSLKALIQQIKTLDHKAPENGLVLCAGDTKYCV